MTTPEERRILEKAALHYDLGKLKEHIERSRANIKIFEDAITKERKTIEDDEYMIAFLEDRKEHVDQK